MQFGTDHIRVIQKCLVAMNGRQIQQQKVNQDSLHNVALSLIKTMFF